MSNVLRFPTKKSKSLFAYLVIYKERTFARVTLAGKFWPESEEGKAHRNLNTEIWRLRTMFRSSGLEPETFLHSDHDSIGFRRESDHWVDVAEFDALTQALSAHHTPQHVPCCCRLSRRLSRFIEAISSRVSSMIGA